MFPTDYSQVSPEYLSNIEVAATSTTNIELLTENLVVLGTAICGVPPLYLITKEGGVYKRRRRSLVDQRSVVQYAQVLSEHLSNIEICG
ncbi:MAG: hypothetical protein JGK17_28225 [Microcoleus sp. PH2017_10_PVI_O_A]|uniref:hypothetical protein n=1 Tax=unclassified Microcoleus TaxID=2642155 RepID=UPI001D989778|nr:MULTISPECIES: hypothetical protein [unclassified Microcoleus]MCC3409374.1 hypothetical protein [Microcoleus sp. PH2017_10_PVI_O_A]MCC3463617.1 hypothetical protein [Microcoleus sp. PH2017_11_PCY_U_A]MCC3481975.1 hypothetical protein [Microcoleus sp. PH2017_12_PCY_D_A]MCC3562952.1 hypothetical protein [Microcoleus sp. PH2017_27_LUM_O_A]